MTYKEKILDKIARDYDMMSAEGREPNGIYCAVYNNNGENTASKSFSGGVDPRDILMSAMANTLEMVGSKRVFMSAMGEVMEKLFPDFAATREVVDSLPESQRYVERVKDEVERRLGKQPGKRKDSVTVPPQHPPRVQEEP